ncbi:MAG: hypothetical protein K1X51_06830 [Rhodospirillaceae bacterium]|nr:hypothetical protein [Rhodospirillaceae bacterium]
MAFRKTLIAALCVASAAMAADAPKPGPINACTLLTDAEVAAAIGAKVTPGKRQDEGDVGDRAGAKGTYSSTCFWKVISDKPDDPNKPMGGATFAILNAMQWPAGSGEAKKFLESFFDAAKNGVIDQTPVQLKIADDAIWWGDGVAARKGDRSFGISVFWPDKKREERRTFEEALARKIAPRL